MKKIFIMNKLKELLDVHRKNRIIRSDKYLQIYGSPFING